MTVALANEPPSEQAERTFISDLLHAVSQPLTALECGLEVSLRTDKTAAQFRERVASALVAAKLLHQQLIEARVLQDAGEPGDTRLPVAVKVLLLQLREELLPVANSRRVRLDVKCETAMVVGNDVRFRDGFFHLMEYLLRTCASRRTVSIHGRQISPAVLEVSFSSCVLTRANSFEPRQPANPPDLGLQIAHRTFRAAGGDLVVTQNESGHMAGYVRLVLAH